MNLYEDYCPRCPCPIIEVDNLRRNGPPDPAKCHYCTAKTLKDALASYIDAEWAIKKLMTEQEVAARGRRYFGGRQQEFRNLILKNIEHGQYRVIKVGNQAIVLDYTRDDLRIRFATLEKE